MNSFGAKMKEIRLNKNLTFVDVKKISKGKLSDVYILEMEKNKFRPSDGKLKILSEVYDLPFNELVRMKNGLAEVKFDVGEKKEKYFGDILKELRLKNKFTLKEVQDALKGKIHAILLSAYENCRFFPKDDKIKLLAKIYKVEYEKLKKDLESVRVLKKKAVRGDYKKELIMYNALMKAGVQRWTGYARALEIYSKDIEMLEEERKERRRQSKREYKMRRSKHE